MDRHAIDTERLRLRPFRMEEAEPLHSLWTLPGVRRYLWDDETISFDQTVGILERSAELFEERGYGLWSIRLRTSAELLGFGGYWHFRNPPELELLVGIHPDHWRRGIASESAGALIRYGFEVLGHEEIRGSTDAPNRASLALMRSLGMEYDGREVVGGLDTVFYRLPAPEPGPARTEAVAPASVRPR